MNFLRAFKFAFILSSLIPCSVEAEEFTAALQTTVQELRSKGFSGPIDCSAGKIVKEEIPLSLKIHPLWGSREYACELGGYRLQSYVGQSSVVVRCEVGAHLNSGHGKPCPLTAVSSVVGNSVACIHFVAAQECGLTPGIIPLRSAGVTAKAPF